MLTLPTQEELDKLREAAEAANGWFWETVQGDQFGHLNEDGSFYDIGTVDADQYGIEPEDEHNSVVLAYIVMVSPPKVAALLSLIDAQNKRIAELLEDNNELHI